MKLVVEPVVRLAPVVLVAVCTSQVILVLSSPFPRFSVVAFQMLLKDGSRSIAMPPDHDLRRSLEAAETNRSMRAPGLPRDRHDDSPPPTQPEHRNSSATTGTEAHQTSLIAVCIRRQAPGGPKWPGAQRSRRT